MGTTTTPLRKPQNRVGGERRGNTADRARRRAFLLAWWGDGVTCQCVYCGSELRDVPLAEQQHGHQHREHVTADKIIPHEDGPGYVRTNIIPACIICNDRRGDKDFDVFASMCGVDAAAILAHVLAAPKRGLTRK